MSDYLFMLENHLDAGQSQAVVGVQRLATEANMNAWLTGGAMRDMLRGAPIRDLDFTVERDAIKTGRALALSLGGEILGEDPLKRFIELSLPGGVTASLSNARSEKYLKPGGKPHIEPATIHADLSRRDFTINAIALSLSRGSRGLLVDPTNGQADLAAQELRPTNSYALFDDPTRIIRLLRFRHTLGFNLAPRAQSQLENALLANYQAGITAAVLAHEIRAASRHFNAAAFLEELDSHGLLKILSPSLTGAKLNAAGLRKLAELSGAVLPAGFEGGWLAFLAVLGEKLNQRDRAEFTRNFALPAAELATLKKLDASVTELESALKPPKAARPSQVWEAVSAVSPDVVLLTLYRSAVRAVQDRLRAHYEKYLPLASEVTDEEVIEAGAKPGTPKFDKARRALIAARLNARPPKPEVSEPQLVS